MILIIQDDSGMKEAIKADITISELIQIVTHRIPLCGVAKLYQPIHILSIDFEENEVEIEAEEV